MTKQKNYPRFKIGDLINYNPVMGKHNRPDWEVKQVHLVAEQYMLTRIFNGKRVNKLMSFRRQRSYRLANTSFENQPPMWPQV